MQRTAAYRVCIVIPIMDTRSHPRFNRLKWVFNAYDELLQLWCYACDLDAFELGASEVVTFMTGEVRYRYP